MNRQTGDRVSEQVRALTYHKTRTIAKADDNDDFDDDDVDGDYINGNNDDGEMMYTLKCGHIKTQKICFVFHVLGGGLVLNTTLANHETYITCRILNHYNSYNKSLTATATTITKNRHNNAT